MWAEVDQRQTEQQMQKTKVKEHLEHTELSGEESVAAL